MEDHEPSHLMTRERVSGSESLWDVIVKGCHWSFEISGMLMNIVLVGLYFKSNKKQTNQGKNVN